MLLVNDISVLSRDMYGTRPIFYKGSHQMI